jgi:hypothetical protein
MMNIKENDAGGPPSFTLKELVNPFAMSDEWGLLTDGTIAIVRVHDYHIDWIDPNGTQPSTPKMTIEWRRYTEAEQMQRADSMRGVIEAKVKRSFGLDGSSTLQVKVDIGLVPDSEFPQFWPPVEPGAVIADLDGHLWILPTTAPSTADGFTYDVVDMSGRVFERVRLPKGRVLVGFGPGGTMYLTRSAGAMTYLERARLPSRPRSPFPLRDDRRLW